MANIIKIGALSSPESPNYALETVNGTTIHVFHAREIKVITEALRLHYEVLPSETIGYQKPGENWTGILELMFRSEISLAIFPMSLIAEVPREINFAYPCCISDTTFMTNKAEPVSKSSAIFHPFSYSVWIALAMILIAVPLLFYIFLNRKVKYSSILFDVFGYLLEQSLSFDLGRNNVRMFLTSWLLGAMIISYGYKAVLLSSLTIPTTTIIRHIPDLARAAEQNSVTCFGYPGADIKPYSASDNEDWRSVGACMKKNEANFAWGEFYKLTSKKAFINTRYGLSFDEKDYFISKDSFYSVIYAYIISKDFCCLKKLNKLVHSLNAFGIYRKIEEDDKFFWQYFVKDFRTKDSAPSETSPRISVSDISGAYFMLLIGWLLGVLTLIGEISVHKYIIGRK